MQVGIQGRSAEVSRQGKGAPVVLLHGSASSGAQWRSLTSLLADRHNVLAPDLIGYGSTPGWAARGGFSLAREASLVRGVLGALGEPAHLVGHSYGGAVALHIARAHPELLSSLTLIEPVAFHLLREGDAIDAQALREIEDIAGTLSRALARGDHSDGMGRFVDYWNGAGTWAASAEDKRRALMTHLGKIVLDFEATLNEPAGLEAMRRIAAPTLIVQGGCTTLPARCVCKMLEDAIPGATLRIVRSAGHMLPLTHRDEVNALVARHLLAWPGSAGAQALAA
jgi:pimeloyl-ACP methyl ester carboxylesterase